MLVLAVLAILAGLNYVAYKRPLRKDFTKNQRYSLSEQTKKVVRGLKEDVRVLYFQRSADLARDPAADRLKDYEALSPHVKAEFVDPLARPARAREYEVRGPWPIAVVERGETRERAQSASEQDLTNAFIKVTRAGKKTVCFAEGEGERDIDDSGEGGFSSARDALAKSQYETRKVVLAREAKVPDDCTVLVVAGPQTDLLPRGGRRRRDLGQGGRQGPRDDRPSLQGAPGQRGRPAQEVQPGGRGGPGGGRLRDGPALRDLRASRRSWPPRTRTTRSPADFRVMTAFHEARSVQAGTGTTDGVSAQNLLQTSPASWAETDLSLKPPIRLDEGKDRAGPVSLGAVATVTVPEAPSPSPSPVASPSPGASPSPAAGDEEEAPKPPRKEGRVASFGDSDFASNALLAFQGNRDLFLNTVAWLAEDADLISIRPKEPEDQRLILTVAQQSQRGAPGPGRAARRLRGPRHLDLVEAAVKRPAFLGTYIVLAAALRPGRLRLPRGVEARGPAARREAQGEGADVRQREGEGAVPAERRRGPPAR